MLKSCFPFFVCCIAATACAGERPVPVPAPGNPGNVFYAGQPVRITPPEAANGARWEVRDIEGTAVASGAISAGAVDTGITGIGWYAFTVFDTAGKELAATTLAVLEPLTLPVPEDSPVCVDAGVSWFARDNAEEQALRLRLAALTGVNWIRDRFTWQIVMPGPETVAAEDTTFDSAAAITAREGLNLLQTFHSTPEWARNPDLDPVQPGKRFPRDLRAMYRFCGLAARRYQDRVRAWEPWNEAEITGFGGHLINEIASLQKAAWWGFKNADPDLTVCAVPASTTGTPLYHEGLRRNELSAYFDTFNFHNYSRPEAWPETFRAPLESAAGKPLWLTECGIKVNAATKAPWGDIEKDAALQQARFIPVAFATSIFSGVDRHYFFLLGNYIERTTQFGVLRHDFTPRPAYVALANAGRMLMGAAALGRKAAPEKGSHLYAFRARHHGEARDVLVLWADEEAPWPLPDTLETLTLRDLSGRRLDTAPRHLKEDPVFAVLEAGAAETLSLETPPEPAPRKELIPSPVVMQVAMPQAAALIQKQAYQVAVEEAVTVPVHVYNFGGSPAKGMISVAEKPEGWRVSVDASPLLLEAGSMTTLNLTATLPRQGRSVLRGGWITLRGAFDGLSDPVLSFRLAGEPGSIAPSRRIPIAGILDPARWEENIVPGATMECSALDGGLLIDMHFPDVHPWCYPILKLRPEEKAPHDAGGLALTIRLIEGDARVRVQFQEENGAFYIGETDTPRDSDAPHRATVFFAETTWRAATEADADSHLTPEDITHLLVGVNARPESRVRLWISDPAWVQY
jgi:hypothetical protein